MKNMNMTAFGKSKRKDGFTFIDLLVIIAVIALLAATLLPVLAAVGNRSQMVADLDNNRQIMLAMNMFAANNNESMPQPGWGQGNAADSSTGTWLSGPNGSFTLGNGSPVSTPVYNVRVAAQRNSFTKGQLYPYLKFESRKVLLCPADVDNALFRLRPENICSYVWNGGVAKYPSLAANNYTTVKLSDPNIKPSFIVQWEGDETLPAFFWNDFANFPDEGVSRRHGNVAPVGLMDGSAREMQLIDFYNMAGNAASPQSGHSASDVGKAVPAAPNDLWWFLPGF